MSQGVRLGRGERLEVVERVAAGVTQLAVAEALGFGVMTVRRVLVAVGGAPSRRSRRRPRSPLWLSLVERGEIRAGIAAGGSFRAIARGLGRAPSTVSREVGGAGRRASYRATRADDRACLAARRPKRSKLACSARLRRAVTVMLERRFSPQQLSVTLKREFPDDQEIRIAPETIYQSLYIQSRGRRARTLRATCEPGVSGDRPAAVLLVRDGSRRCSRSPSGRPRSKTGRYPVYWEGGSDRRQGQPRIHRHAGGAPDPLGDAHAAGQGRHHRDRDHENRRADRAAPAAPAAVADLGPGPRASPPPPVHGRHRHQGLLLRPPLPGGSAPSKENTNGPLRQYLPNGTDLAIHDQKALDRVAAELNGRPRQTLRWATPAEKMTELLRRPPDAAEPASTPSRRNLARASSPLPYGRGTNAAPTSRVIPLQRHSRRRTSAQMRPAPNVPWLKHAPAETRPSPRYWNWPASGQPTRA